MLTVLTLELRMRLQKMVQHVSADVAESHLFRHSDSYLYSGAALS